MTNCVDLLRELQIEDAAVAGFVDRLEEAKGGRLTGRAWGGSIVM